MKVALIRPNYETHLVTPPLGIGYVSSYLKKEGHDVLFVDGLNMGLTADQIVQRVKGYPVIGITVLTDFYLEAKVLTGKLKKLGKTVILGGVHPTILPEEAVNDSGADFAVVGEGEVSMAELVRAIENGDDTSSIKGVLSRKNPSCYRPRDFVQNLDDLPFPDWESMDPRKYKKAPHGALIKNFPVAPVTSSRGCPYECTFCVSPKFWKRQIRFRSPENVVGEIEYLVNTFGVKEIHFEDDNLTLRREHIEKICNLIMKKRLKISWATPNGIRADKVDEKLLRLMKKAGCYYVVFGVESGNQDILNNIKKHETLKDIEHAVRLAAKVGMMTQGFFIFGLPGETDKTVRNTIDFAKRLPLDRAQFLLLDLLPGSELWEQHKHELKVDYSKRSYQDITWVPKTISPQKLKDAQAVAFKQFFFRPRPMFSLIRYFKPAQLKFILGRLKDFRIFSLRKKK
jgi:radical SAM superfamily enzyme YgiQ (UPF0313 family)